MLTIFAAVSEGYIAFFVNKAYINGRVLCQVYRCFNSRLIAIRLAGHLQWFYVALEYKNEAVLARYRWGLSCGLWVRVYVLQLKKPHGNTHSAPPPPPRLWEPNLQIIVDTGQHHPMNI